MSKHYVLISHGVIIERDGTREDFKPNHIESKLFFYVNEGCVLSTFPYPNGPEIFYPDINIKNTICNQEITNKDVINYNGSYPNMKIYPTAENCEIFIQDCISHENIVDLSKLRPRPKTLDAIIDLINTYHNSLYRIPYILHVFSCRGYKDEYPSVSIKRSLSGVHDEEIKYKFTREKYEEYENIIKFLPPSLKSDYLKELNDIFTPREYNDMINRNRVITLDLNQYDRLIILGNKLFSQPGDIELFPIKQSLKSKRPEPVSTPAKFSDQLYSTESSPFERNPYPLQYASFGQLPFAKQQFRLPVGHPSINQQSFRNPSSFGNSGFENFSQQSTFSSFNPPSQSGTFSPFNPPPQQSSTSGFGSFNAPRQSSTSGFGSFNAPQPFKWKNKYLKYKEKYLNLKNK